jgi:predicted nucleic acid-binding protein
MIVADASVVIELVLGTAVGAEFGDWLLANQPALHAPHLIDVEVLQGLRKLEMLRTILPERARDGLHAFASLRLNRHLHTTLLPRAWVLRANVTAYDAMYLALAEQLEAPLHTRDQPLARAKGHKAKIKCW